MARAVAERTMTASMPPKEKNRRPFDAQAFLESDGLGTQIVSYARQQIVFSQGDRCDSVMYLRSGRIRLSVLSGSGKEAVLATLDPGEFLGEGAVAGHPVRLITARTTMASTVLVVPKRQMIRLLHSHHAFSGRFIAHMLGRNARLEADLLDHLFNSSEKRLARALLLLARYGKGIPLQTVLPRISQTTLAEMVGTTRSRVNFFMNKFKALGFIEYGGVRGSLRINPALLTVVVHDDWPRAIHRSRPNCEKLFHS